MSKTIGLSDADYAGRLYCAVFGTEEDFDDVNVKGVLNVLNTLSERERYVLECRFRYGKTLKAIGNEIGVTNEVIRQNEVKALRKLRHPSRSQPMKIETILKERDHYMQRADAYGVELAKANEVIKELRRILDTAVAGLPINAVANHDPLQADVKDICNTVIEDMDLSVRTYNCVKRAGYNTLGDLLTITYEQVYKIRNLGKRSLDELIDKVHGLGFRTWPEHGEEN